jgi:hypothetical protein
MNGREVKSDGDLLLYATVVRWIARTLGFLYFALIAFFVIAHALSPDGLPSPWQMSPAEQLDTVALLLMVLGSVLGLKWEGVGGAMILFGTALWLLFERHLPWPPGLTLLIGALYLFTWWISKLTLAKRMQAAQ